MRTMTVRRHALTVCQGITRPLEAQNAQSAKQARTTTMLAEQHHARVATPDSMLDPVLSSALIVQQDITTGTKILQRPVMEKLDDVR
jgi:hypothetical protein